MGSFAEARKEQLSRWMGGPEGEALAEVFGGRQDELMAEFKAAVKARFPSLAASVDATDALPHLGAERKIWRFPTEDYSSILISAYVNPALTYYDERLRIAHLLWYWAGTKSAMYNVFAPVDDTYVAPTETWFTYEVAETTVIINRDEPSYSDKLHVINNVEGPVVHENHYSAFAMVFDARGGEWTSGPNWDAFVWDDGHLWNSSMTIDEARYIIFQVLTWKAVISYPVRVGLWTETDYMFWDCALWDDGWLWAPHDHEFVYLTIGHCEGEHVDDGGWISDGGVGTYQVWDGGWSWAAYENPYQFGRQD